MWIFFFAAAAVPLLGAVLWRVRASRQLYPPVDHEALTLYEAAHLRGGAPAVADVALVSLYLTGRLEVRERRLVPVGGPPVRDPVQVAAYASAGAEGRGESALEVRRKVSFCPPVRRVEEVLAGRGLVPDGKRLAALGRVNDAVGAFAVLAALLCIAALVADSLTGEGSGIAPLIAFGVLGAVTGVLWFVPRRFGRMPSGHATRAGLRRLREVKEDRTWQPRLVAGVPIVGAEADVLADVARYGADRAPAALAPLLLAPWPLVPVVAAASSSDSSGSSDSGGSKGSGGCGGGCGSGCGSGCGGGCGGCGCG
ncbi:TIGR04222 domain-containing membrane protein [Streptomyces sp. NPDC059917]|uniref:TIGR04222 domain-containing membrane protein n=1 Tax=Streptomyces sp. NPDC059917 TaxID=3347002 RepID=UPI003666CDF5